MTFSRTAPGKREPEVLAPEKFENDKSQFSKSHSERLALTNLQFIIFALEKSQPVRFAPEKSALFNTESMKILLDKFESLNRPLGQ